MRMCFTLIALLPLLLATGSCSRVPRDQISSAEFASIALPLLPIEQPYDFHKALSQGLAPRQRDPNAQPTPEEMTLSAQGWILIMDSDAGIALRQAVEELRVYLESAMDVYLSVETRGSLAGWQSLQNTIVAGSREQLLDCGSALEGSKDYQIIVSPERIVICGFDERGAMYGLYNLQQRMSLREAPFLPSNLNTSRHSLYRARMTLSGLGWMEWPDPYLALLPRYGFDSIFTSIYVNPNNAPGVGPHWDKMKPQDESRLRELIRRAAGYGIDLYCPILYLYTGEPENEAGLRALVRDIVTKFPEIRGYVLLTEGFFFKNWFGAGGGENLREWSRNWARGVSIVAEETRKINPAIEVLPWEYNIDFRPQQVELKRYVISQLPLDTIPLLTFENGKSFELDGQRGWLRDYAINQVGPAEVTEAQIAEAKRRGMRGVYAKADTWASWQFGTFPYLPFPYQWYARYEALKRYEIDGTLESWSYGFKPNFIAEIRAWYSWSDAPPLDELLRKIARREFGPGSEEDVLKAWDHFSRAIRVFPDTGPNWGTNNAVAAPFFFQKPKPRAMTLAHSWNDQKLWSRSSQLNPYWPYVPSRLILYPDFSNQVNVAERYVRFFTIPVFSKYLLLAADEMEKGLEAYRRAALRAPEPKKRSAFREVLLAEQLQRMMRSEQALIEFEDLRFGLSKTDDLAERGLMLERMSAILEEEIVRTEASLEGARRDSRLGYEWEQDYIYTPHTIEEKLKLLRLTLTQQIPAYRVHLREKAPE